MKKDKKYYFIVRAINRVNDESLASNEIEVITAIPPGSPKSLFCSVIHVKNKKKAITAELLLKQPDGKNGKKIKSYRIYKKVPSGYMKIGETKENKFTAKRFYSDKTSYFSVRSVDDIGNKSYDSNTVHTRELFFHVSLRGALSLFLLVILQS